MNNLETALCHSLSCQSSVLVFIFHLKFYYFWVHWLMLLTSQKCFKSSASTFFFSLLHKLGLYLAIILLWNQDSQSVYGFNRPTSANLYFKTLTKPCPFFPPANSVYPAFLKQRHSPGVIAVKSNFVTGFKSPLSHMSHHGLLSDFSHSQIPSFLNNIYDKADN